MLAAQSPRAIWRRQTLRLQSIAWRSIAPFYRGERLQTYLRTAPLPAASGAPSNQGARDRIIQDAAPPALDPVPSQSVAPGRCVDALARSRGRQRFYLREAVRRSHHSVAPDHLTIEVSAQFR